MPPSADQEPAASHRTGRFHANALALVGARGLTVALALAQVAIALPYLGEARYGAWMLLQAIAAAVHICDFGIGLGTQQAMAEALARRAPEEARQIARTGAQWLAALGAIVLVGSAALLFFPAWLDWTGLEIWADEVLPAALALAVFTAAALPLNMAPRLAAAGQMHWIQGLWAVVGSLATLLWVAAMAAVSGNLALVVGGAAGIAVLQNIGMGWHALHRLRWGGQTGGTLPAGRRRELLRACSGYAVPQFGQALVQGAPSAALSLAGGPAAVTAFNLVQRLLAPLTQVQGLVLTSLWPAYTEAAARRDAVWVRQKFRESLLFTAGIVLAMGVVASQAGSIIAIWTRHSVDALPAAVVWAAFGWLVTLVAVHPFSVLLIGLGEWRALARATAVGYPATGAAFFLGASSGQPIVTLASGTAIGAVTLLPLLIRQARRLLRQLPAPAHS